MLFPVPPEQRVVHLVLPGEPRFHGLPGVQRRKEVPAVRVLALASRWVALALRPRRRGGEERLIMIEGNGNDDDGG